jgi:cytochrome P450
MNPARSSYNAYMKLWSRMPPRLRRHIVSATEIAGQRGAEAAVAEDLLRCICEDRESAAVFVLESARVAPAELLKRLEVPSQNGEPPRQRAQRLDGVLLRLLERAAMDADRLHHAHIGTEHVLLATCESPSLPSGQVLNSLGLTPAIAEAAIQRWLEEEMPRRNADIPTASAAGVMKVPGFFRKLVKAPAAIYKIFFRKSLAHPKFVSDPYPLYRWLREREPVRKDPLAPVWVLTRYADIALALKDSRFKKDPFATERLAAPVREQLGVDVNGRSDVETVSMLFLDPPQHTRIRQQFSRAFTPRRIENLRPKIQTLCDRRLDAVMRAGKMDIIETIAYPLPITVIADLLGFPAADYQKFKKWSDDFATALALNAKPEQHAVATRSHEELRAYFDDLAPQLQREPGDNLISAFLQMEQEPGAMTREELFINSTLLLAAGHETTTNLIGNGMLALLRHPDQLRLLRDDPSLIESAVEELFRYDSPVQWMSRVVGEPIQLNGIQLEPGTLVLGSFGAANRDPAQFKNPETFDIRRQDNKHLSLGLGTHYCLGAALARMEAQIAVGTIVRRCRNIRLARQKLKWKKGLTFRALEALEVEFEASSDATTAC